MNDRAALFRGFAVLTAAILVGAATGYSAAELTHPTVEIPLEIAKQLKAVEPGPWPSVWFNNDHSKVILKGRCAYSGLWDRQLCIWDKGEA